MLAKCSLVTACILLVGTLSLGQVLTTDLPNTNSSTTTASAWRPAGENTPRTDAPDTVAEVSRLTTDDSRQPIARVTSGTGTLPNKYGQVWREYDISPYTLRVTSTKRPEQAIVDWILQETGYEVWHSEPLGILSATPRTLRVYHTPDMQEAVAELVDRFVGSQAETSTFSLRVVTLDSPDWRARVRRLMQPVDVPTPGVSAWLLQKEDAAILSAELRRRTDYREHHSPHFMINNGQSTLVSTMRSRNYIADVVPRGDVWPGYESETAQVDEGFSLEFSPLLSIDRQMIDAMIKCEINQVEKMIPVSVDVPSVAAPRQRTQIQVPQMAHFRFEQRFRWPADRVLLVGMGVVAVPVPVEPKLQELIPGVPLPFSKSPARADLLVFVESKGKTGQTSSAAGDPLREAKTYRGRY
ncbi:MAG TPA: hypothetical protein VMY42_00680 [Thermoguttaceae bacterium]|nr:hypothetical protein [Thermoguttaceae bacterium]